jgi:hypothetical protein
MDYVQDPTSTTTDRLGVYIFEIPHEICTELEPCTLTVAIMRYERWCDKYLRPLCRWSFETEWWVCMQIIPKSPVSS